MADGHTEETRSYIMSRIKAKDTKPEMPALGFAEHESIEWVFLIAANSKLNLFISLLKRAQKFPIV
jgi:DNA mismatch endonuclease Vsr